MEINTNISASILQKSLNLSNIEVNQSITKMATGKGASAAEDAARLILTETENIKRQSSMQAMENTQAGISMLQTAEGGMSNINDNIQRIRELSLQGMNGTNGETERAAIKEEISQLRSQIDNVANSTSFNNIKLLDGSGSNVSIQTGIDGDASTSTSSLNKSLGSFTVDSLGIPTNGELDIMFAGGNAGAEVFNKIDSAINTVSKYRANVGAIQSKLENNIDSLAKNTYTGVTSNDTDFAKESMNMAMSSIKQSASASLLAQANQQPAIALSIIGS